MKKFILLPIAVLCFSFGLNAQDYRKISNVAFKRGEILKYRIHYGAVNAGTATLSVDYSNTQIGGRNSLHVIGTGETKGSFDWFFKVRDRYESYMDEDALMPWIFIRRVNEGGFLINQNQTFDHSKGKVNSNGKTLDVPEYIQDMLSSFYYARTLDFSNAKVGDKYEVNCFIDDEIWDLKIKYLGVETIDSDLGNIKCLKFCPVVQKGRVFKKEEDLTIYISDDSNHIPVRAQGELMVGSVKLDLMGTAGLYTNLNIVK